MENNNFSDRLTGLNLSEHFRLKSMELARQGYFGRLKTRLPEHQNNFFQLISLLDNPYTPLSIYSEAGCGKKTLLKEYVQIENVYRRLAKSTRIELRELSPLALISSLYSISANKSLSRSYCYYCPNIEDASPREQREIELILRKQKKAPLFLSENRLIFSAEKSLALLVKKGLFSESLFELLNENSFHLNKLNDRGPDLVDIVSSLLYDITGSHQIPQAFVFNQISSREWPQNFTTLKWFLKMLIHKIGPDTQLWTEEEFLTVENHFFGSLNEDSEIDSNPHFQEDVEHIRAHLSYNKGNIELTAHTLQISKSELLFKMVKYGIR